MEYLDNVAIVSGYMVSPVLYSHTTAEEDFYKFDILCQRKSDAVDVLPVIISNRLLATADFTRKHIEVFGEFRSHSHFVDGKRKLKIFIFAKRITCDDDFIFSINDVALNGYICKKPTYRVTPLGREISDVLLAVKKLNRETAYIPCVFWGEDARSVKDLEVGSNIKVFGRMQSREYWKEDRFLTAYEVSVNKYEGGSNGSKKYC